MKDGEVYQLSAVGSASMTFALVYQGTIAFIKKIDITSDDKFTVTNTSLSSAMTTAEAAELLEIARGGTA